jgi:succinoglycan biosynthesis transport protein ExoP
MQIQYPEIHLQDYVYVLKKRLWIVILAVAFTLFAAVFVTLRATIIYKATATILIEKENPNIVDFKEIMSFDSSSNEYYQTQYQVIKSRSLIEALVEKENLAEDSLLKGMKKGGLRKILKDKMFFKKYLSPFLTDKTFADLVSQRLLKVDPIRNSRLVDISFFHTDPEKAAKLANSLVSIYVKKNLENRFLISAQARELLSEQLDELKTKVAIADKRLQRYKEENDLISLPSLVEKDKFLQDARLELVRLEGEKARLEKRYLPEHPKYIHIESEISAVRGQIRKEEEKQMDLGRVAIDYTELEREADSARQTYQSLLARYQEMNSEANTQASNVTIIDLAESPRRPYSPKPFVSIAVSIFLGIVFGVLLAFFLEYLDATVKTPDDVENALGLDLLGVIPKTSKDKKNPLRGEIFASRGKPNQATEAFRALRTALLFKLKHVPGCRTIVVTSPNPAEGKSTVSLNLAVSFQQNHLKVLLIDSDLRKPKLHVRMEIEAGKGLTDVLEGSVSFDSVVHRNAKDLGFDLLSSGTQSSRPTELLGSVNMESFMAMMKKEYDIIIIDSPPYLAVADVSVIGTYADASIIIAKYQETEKRHLKNLKKRFAEMDGKLLAVIINQVNVGERDYYYHQYYYYGYGNEASPKE